MHIYIYIYLGARRGRTYLGPATNEKPPYIYIPAGPIFPLGIYRNIYKYIKIWIFIKFCFPYFPSFLKELGSFSCPRLFYGP